MLCFDWRWPLLHVFLFSCVMSCVIFDSRSEGVNVQRCFYLTIIHLKDWLTCQTAEGGLISSLMFRPPTRNSSSLSSSPSNFFCFFSDLSETADFVSVQFCPSLFSSVSTCPSLHSQNSQSVKDSSHCRWKTFCKESLKHTHSTSSSTTTTTTTTTFTFQDGFERLQT